VSKTAVLYDRKDVIKKLMTESREIDVACHMPLTKWQLMQVWLDLYQEFVRKITQVWHSLYLIFIMWV